MDIPHPPKHGRLIFREPPIPETPGMHPQLLAYLFNDRIFRKPTIQLPQRNQMLDLQHFRGA